MTKVFTAFTLGRFYEQATTIEAKPCATILAESIQRLEGCHPVDLLKRLGDARYEAACEGPKGEDLAANLNTLIRNILTTHVGGAPIEVPGL